MMMRGTERLLGVALILGGIGCTSVYVNERTQSGVELERGIERFELAQAASTEARVPTSPSSREDLAAGWRAAARTADTSEWAPGRIEAWQAAQRDFTEAPVALLDIPALDLRIPVYEGADDPQLDLGVGRIPGTTRIGQAGNIGLSSHRDGYFRKLRHIEIGDRILLQALDGQTYVYEVHERSVIDPEDVHLLYPQGDDRVTLVTCYPFWFVGPAPQRFIVVARRVPAQDASPPHDRLVHLP